MAITYLRRKILGRRQGQATVELALIIPVLLLLVLGIFELGRLLNALMTLQHAVREGARLGTLGATDGEITATIQARAVSLDPSRLAVQITPGEIGRIPGTIVTVGATYEFTLMIPMIGTFLRSPFPISSSLSMRIE